MDLNFVFFPGPKLKKKNSVSNGDLIWIPKVRYKDDLYR